TDAVGRSRQSMVLGRRLLGLALVIGCALLVWSASASALVHRGHEFGTTFEGTGANAFSKVGGLAVNQATGEVYVSDPAHERVERFKPNGTGFEFAGELGKSVPGAGSIAVDNDAASPSHGDVYVAGFKNKNEEELNWLYKFNAAGEIVYKKHIFKSKE